MPSFMSISARVQELFRENRGGRYKPPRRSGVKGRVSTDIGNMELWARG